MKRSAYNYFVEWNNFYCGVNLFTGYKMVLLKNDYEKFTECNAQIDNKIYSELIAGGFIVDEAVDEYAKIIHRRNNDVFFNNNIFHLIILPTIECNFRCWYCYEQHVQSIMSASTIEKIHKYIDYIFESYPMFTFHLDWFGGEPLLYFKEVIKPISLYVKSLCAQKGLHFKNTITTNGYLIDDNLINEFNDIELNSFQITLDGYKQTHNKVRFELRGDDSYTQIINNINTICQKINNASVNLRINYTNKNIDNLGLIADDITPSNRDKVYISLQRVWQTREIENEELIKQNLIKQVDYLQCNNISVNYNKNIYGLGKRCYADSVRQSVVNFDGTLFKCTARNFADSKASVGFLNEDGIPIWNNQYFKHFLKPVFDNEKCKKCQFVPICLGMCSQKYIERGEAAIENDCTISDCEESLKEELFETLYEYISNWTKTTELQVN